MMSKITAAGSQSGRIRRGKDAPRELREQTLRLADMYVQPDSSRWDRYASDLPLDDITAGVSGSLQPFAVPVANDLFLG